MRGDGILQERKRKRLGLISIGDCEGKIDEGEPNVNVFVMQIVDTEKKPSRTQGSKREITGV